MTIARLQPILDGRRGTTPLERYRQGLSIFNQIPHADLDDESKCRLATFFIEETCSRIGA
jgi:hypothetical protein